MKFGNIPPGGLGDAIKWKLLMDGLTDEGHPMITLARLESMAQVS